jgi:hypothetical protein
MMAKAGGYVPVQFGKRYVVQADEKLCAFLELERAVCIHLLSENLEK